MKTTTEIKHIPIRAYTANGEPTCGVDFSNGASCQFVSTRKMGLVEICTATGKDLEEYALGFLAPSVGCPVWGVKND